MWAWGLGKLVAFCRDLRVDAGHFMISWRKVEAWCKVTAIGSVSQCSGHRRPDINCERLVVRVQLTKES